MMNTISTTSTPRVKTGIPEFDAMLRGGFMKGDAVMLAGSAGTGKTTLRSAVPRQRDKGRQRRRHLPDLRAAPRPDIQGRQELRLGPPTDGGRRQAPSRLHFARPAHGRRGPRVAA